MSFLYRDVLREGMLNVDLVASAKRPIRLPVVLSRADVRAVLAGLDGVPLLVSQLLYGAGLRLLECLTLRVKDIDFERGQVFVRAGKGARIA